MQEEAGPLGQQNTGVASVKLELDARPLQALATAPAAANNQRLGLAVGMLTAGPLAPLFSQ